ncbi:hypothetical protein L1889_13135 [Paenalcaligenes niemegkensis]|uniref:hypothetical protein n=1 Tax=Paenalcaligenes niemegkensis TaxID=2895469 RepID=UPI001EE82169|nr:hypothetical protein [Paenalcaligenes niemegkensis]MCQ9617511.1 hypothetical protein [Paenalcaligenes niemegkensis]
MWFLLGCSPEYNWRNVQMAEGAVEQIFPASPLHEQIPMGQGAQSPAYSVASAKVRETLFMATWVPRLPEQHIDDVYEHVVDGILQRAGDTRTTRPSAGDVFSVQSQGRQNAVRTDLRVQVYGTGLLQLSVSTPLDQPFPEEAAHEFLSYPRPAL